MQQTLSYTTVLAASYEDVRAYCASPELEHRMNFLWEDMHGTCERKFKKISDSQTEVTDSITYRVPYGFFHSRVKSRIEKLLKYRHNILKEDLARINQKPLKILLSGASGLVGKHLMHLLPLFHHQLYILVRKPPMNDREIYWDPYKKEIDKKQLEGFDAVIHLSGESIIALRWTRKKKQKIYQSRVVVTEFLAECLNELSSPPKTFLCASAVGFYGDCKGCSVDETASQGKGFLAEVCAAWEHSAQKFTKGRVVCMRFGAILALEKGFLNQCILPFKIGFGHVLGSGKEQWSWISLEDVGYQILHLLGHQDVQGSVNMTTPYPVTSSEFSHELGHVLHRPVWLRIPRFFIKILLGDVGRYLLLSSTQTMPRKLERSGAVFAYPHFKDALKIYLG